jgi:soluble lytic murein transglycosylase-like protein
MKRIYFIIVILTFSITTKLSIAKDKYCFGEAGKMYGIDPEILRSISFDESGHNNSAVNYNSDGSYDFCHMQINSSWAGKIGIDNWLSLGDPCQCSMWAAYILANCIQKHGNSWKAVGCYHSPSEKKRVNYAWTIYKLMKHQKKNVSKKSCIKQKGCVIRTASNVSSRSQ